MLELPVTPELAARVDEEPPNKDMENHSWEDSPAAVHWEEDASDDEEEECEYSDEECVAEVEEQQEPKDALAVLLRRVEKDPTVFDCFYFPYQRGPQPSDKTKKRKAQTALELATAAMDSRPLDKGFLVLPEQWTKKVSPASKDSEPSKEDLLLQSRKEGIKKLEGILRSKKTSLSLLPQNQE
jgi:hypothetical protein